MRRIHALHARAHNDVTQHAAAAFEFSRYPPITAHKFCRRNKKRQKKKHKRDAGGVIARAHALDLVQSLFAGTSAAFLGQIEILVARRLRSHACSRLPPPLPPSNTKCVFAYNIRIMPRRYFAPARRRMRVHQAAGIKSYARARARVNATARLAHGDGEISKMVIN